MKIFKQQFDVRWSDLDANMHLANASFLNFMSHTRMAYLTQNGFGLKEMAKLHIGPIIFHEHIHYFKEIMPNATVWVTIELKGLSEDGMFFEFVHNIYSKDGTNHCYTELQGAFIDTRTRKLTGLPEDLLSKGFTGITKTADFKVLTKEDTRKHNRRPENRPDLFQ